MLLTNSFFLICKQLIANHGYKMPIMIWKILRALSVIKNFYSIPFNFVGKVLFAFFIFYNNFNLISKKIFILFILLIFSKYFNLTLSIDNIQIINKKLLLRSNFDISEIQISPIKIICVQFSEKKTSGMGFSRKKINWVLKGFKLKKKNFYILQKYGKKWW